MVWLTRFSRRERAGKRTPPGTRPIAIGLAPVLIAITLIAAALGPARADDLKPLELRHGVNLSNWLANAQRQPVFDHDFARIKAAGFDHVRIPINPEFLGFSLTEAAGGRVLFDFEQIDQAVGLAMSNGLSVILDIQPGEAFLSQIEQDSMAEAGFISLWAHIADHFRQSSPTVVAFELLNAPKYAGDASRYHDLVEEVIAAIRPAIPKHLLIVDAPRGATIDGFQAFKPVKDSTVQYAFHFYDPDMFTLQGMNFGPQGKPQGRTTRYFRDVPYPSALANPAHNYAPTAPDVTEAKQTLADYIAADWNESRLRARVQLAADWGQANHATIICTEFGARRAFVDAQQRYQWITDTRKALDAAGIPWDLWDYADLFGITKFVGNVITEPVDGSVRFVDPEKGTREIEPEAIKALFAP